MPIGRRAWPAMLLATIVSGCSTAPKSFLGLNDPRAIARARAVSLAGGRPIAEVVPALIARLDDTDVAVRIAAFEELKQETRQDFGYVPWGDPEVRKQAVARWQNWWKGQQAALANSHATQ